jgi:DNA-binding NarL/FixJ family response regulator
MRILIIADNLLTRAGLAALLADQSPYEVVGQVSPGDSLAEDMAVYQPDALLWDFGWQPAAAADRLNMLLDTLGEDDEQPVVVLLPDEAHAAEVAGLLRARPGGVLLRDADPDQLIAALAGVAAGLIVLDPMLADATLASGEALPDSPTDALTPRELEVLQLLAEGLANKMIAHRLGISDHTVKFHVNAIMTKLNVQSRTGAVVKATRLGLIML